MRVFLSDKVTEITPDAVDIEKGRLIDDILVTHIPAREERAEVFHYETVKEYPNGGKDVVKVIDSPAVTACLSHDETEKISVYIPYTKEELDKIKTAQEIEILKAKLSATDYLAIKYAEGVITENEFKDAKLQRAEWRDKINKLEKSL